MSQAPDSQPVTTQDLLAFFKSAIADKPARTAPSYHKALLSVEKFHAMRAPEAPLASPRFLEDWVVAMYCHGLTSKTAIHYLDLISALYSETAAGLSLPPSSAFADVKRRLKGALPFIWTPTDLFEALPAFLRFLKTDPRSGDDPLDFVYRDILLVSMLLGAKPVEEVALMRREEVENVASPARELLAYHTDAKRKYVFPLSQTAYTPRQFRKKLEDEMATLLDRRLVSRFGDIDITVRSYWAATALQCGLSPHRVAATVGRLPFKLPILSICSEVGEREESTNAIDSFLVANPLQWYAMRLRRGVRFSQLEACLKIFGSEGKLPELFYPVEEITKRIGKRIKYRKKPVIHDIVFFRYRVTDIPQLFRKIGDLAWCYRTGGAYAAISPKAMSLFQQTVGQFTPDYEVGESGMLTLAPRERVVVVGGLFSGLEGEVLETESYAEGVVYRLRLFGDRNDIEWRVSAKSALLRSAGKEHKK